MTKLNQISSSKCFGGQQQVYEYASHELGCKTRIAIFLPSTASEPSVKLPVVYYLSGLGSSEQNMITQSGFQRYAEEYQLIIVGPDTSPRGENIPGADGQSDLGAGAGFYVDATQEPWSKNYRMYSYVTKELVEIVEENFCQVDSTRVGVIGHSMGGHGALVVFFRNPHLYRSISLFAPLCSPMKSPWGCKCLLNYLGDDKEAWKEYDATELVKKQPRKNVKILLDQGDQDKYLDNLLPDNFAEACEASDQPLEYNVRKGYDHGYYFVSTFIGDHLKYHACELRK